MRHIVSRSDQSRVGRLITCHWPTYYTSLAGLLHAIGRLIARHWPTCYTQLADLLHSIGRLITHIGRLITRPLDTRSDKLRRRCGFAGSPQQPKRHPSHVFAGLGERWPTYGMAWPTYYMPSLSQGQPRSAKASQGQPVLGVGALSIRVGI